MAQVTDDDYGTHGQGHTLRDLLCVLPRTTRFQYSFYFIFSLSFIFFINLEG